MLIVRSTTFLIILIMTQLIGRLVLHVAPGWTIVNGAALFGLIRHPLGVIILILAGLVLIYRLSQIQGNTLFTWGLILVLVGGASNIIDRLTIGGAIDYIPLGRWSTFNLADIEIVIGALLLFSADNSDKTKNVTC